MDYQRKEEKQIKLELAQEKVKAQFKLQDIFQRRWLETLKNTDTEITNYVAEHHFKVPTEIKGIGNKNAYQEKLEPNMAVKR